MRIIKMLDLATNHLPEDVCDNLGNYTGVIADRRDYGWLLWVPDDVDEHNDGYDVPEVITNIQRFARAIDCDYVLFDSDAEAIDELPVWKW